MSEAPDYSKYTSDELHDARRHVDDERWPARALAIEEEIRVRELDSATHSTPIASKTPKSGESDPSSTTTPIVRKVLSLPLLGVGSIFLMMLSNSWLSSIQSVGAARIIFVIPGGLSAIFLTAGFALWGRKHLELIAGAIAIGVGCLAALSAVTNTLIVSGALGAQVPNDFDNLTSRSLVLGPATSALVLLTVGATLLAPTIKRAFRG